MQFKGTTAKFAPTT